MQEITKFYQLIFTLNCGKQVEICVEEVPADLLCGRETIQILGFVWTPLYVVKVLNIRRQDISAIEVLHSPYLVWKTEEGFEYGPSGTMGRRNTGSGKDDSQ